MSKEDDYAPLHFTPPSSEDFERIKAYAKLHEEKSRLLGPITKPDARNWGTDNPLKGLPTPATRKTENRATLEKYFEYNPQRIVSPLNDIAQSELPKCNGPWQPPTWG